MRIDRFEWMNAFRKGIYFVIYLDGKDVTGFFLFADEEKGIVRHPRNALSHTAFIERSGEVIIERTTTAEYFARIDSDHKDRAVRELLSRCYDR